MLCTFWGKNVTFTWERLTKEEHKSVLFQNSWHDQRALTVHDTTEAKEPTSIYTLNARINKICIFAPLLMFLSEVLIFFLEKEGVASPKY